MKVLVLSAAFAPGFRGGSIRALTHMVERLGDSCAFSIVTHDRDSGQAARLPGILVDTWTEWGRARVFYASTGVGPLLLGRLVKEAAPDVLFLNSVFARPSILALAMRRMRRFDLPTIVAPEGELSPGAMAQKPWRKRAYLTLGTQLGLFHDVTWLAREGSEAADIRRVDDEADAAIVPCLAPAAALSVPPPVTKRPGHLHLLYLSRVTPKKNLAFLLEVLQQIGTGDVHLDIVGPIDSAYWTRCRPLLARLPSNVRAVYQGECEPQDVPRWLTPAHLLVLPTLGENHGYVIAEALEAGRPVLTSDRTPWTRLERESAGWEVPLDAGVWKARIESLLAMDDAAYQRCSDGARRHGVAAAAGDVERLTLDLLARVARTGAGGVSAP